MNASRPSKPWRLLIATPSGPDFEPCTSERTAHAAVETAKATTPGNTIVVQKWNTHTGHWEEWLRWTRRDGTWTAE